MPAYAPRRRRSDTTTVRILDNADLDLDGIGDYLEREAANGVAEKYSVRFSQEFERLRDFPRIGSPRPRLGKRVRMWQVRPYNIFYDCDDRHDVVVILRILHSSRHIKRTMIAR